MSEQRFRKSKVAFEMAKQYMPGGVNSPVRAFKSVGLTPPFMERGEGAYLYDIDGNSYIDYLQAWGPLILGHQHPAVSKSIAKQLEQGISFGTPTQGETLLAKEIKRLVPSVEMVRLGTSGTEVTMSSIRLARGITGRKKIIKFIGCYHGHGDSFLVKAGSGVATFGLPDSPGVPESLAQLTITLPYNNLEEVEKTFMSDKDDIACVIVEPVAGNMGCVPGERAFLEGLRLLCDRYGALLIFDEVMSGLRADYRSAQGYFGIVPDLTCLGKVIGGGLPLAAYGGARMWMEYVAPEGPIYQAGTMAGNPLAVAAGLATLQQLNEELYTSMERQTSILCEGIKSLCRQYEIDVQVHWIGTMFSIFFTSREIKNYEDVLECDTKRFERIYHSLLEEGIYMAPSQFETNFISGAHTQREIQVTLQAWEKALIKEAAFCKEV